jgi:hypothetical protein
MTTTLRDRPAPATAGAQDWLTATLRPAGRMTADAADRFRAALSALAGVSAVVVVDVSASGPLPRAARTALAEADVRLAAAGGALLVLGRGGPAPLPLPAAAG